MASKRKGIGAVNDARQELSLLKLDEFIDALRAIGIVRRAMQEVGLGHHTVTNWMTQDASIAERIRSAQEQGKARRIDYLETKLYEHIDSGNLTAVIFALKREDPSYRESYNVNSTNQPTNYVIDLGAASTSLDDASASTPIVDITG